MSDTTTPRLAADGKTQLDVGMKVRSDKDGMIGLVHALDKSDRYVKVKSDQDGKVRARSTRTLTPVVAAKRRTTRKTAK